MTAKIQDSAKNRNPSTQQLIMNLLDRNEALHRELTSIRVAVAHSTSVLVDFLYNADENDGPDWDAINRHIEKLRAAASVGE